MLTRETLEQDFSSVSIVNFEQLNASWDVAKFSTKSQLDGLINVS